MGKITPFTRKNLPQCDPAAAASAGGGGWRRAGGAAAARTRPVAWAAWDPRAPEASALIGRARSMGCTRRLASGPSSTGLPSVRI